MNVLLAGAGYFLGELRKLGHNALWASFSPGSDLTLHLPAPWREVATALEARGFAPDYVFYADNGNLPLLADPESIPVPTAFYSIDTYCNPWHIPYAHAFDLAYVAQKDFVPLFTADGQDARWLPLFHSHAEPCLPFAEREIPVSFVGTIGHKNNPARKPFLENFSARQPLEIRSGPFAEVFAGSRIVLNQTAFGEINFRCFEAMALGAALLMEECENGFAELFTPGVDILPPFKRNDAEQAAKTAAVFLRKPFILERIANAGRELVLARHSQKARLETILRDYATLAAKDRPPREKRHARTAFGIIASELGGEKWKKMRELFLNLAIG